MLLIALALVCTGGKKETKRVEKKVNTAARWTKEKAWKWYEEQSWLVSANFNPSTAINQLEFWQAESFDPETISRELKGSADLGMI